MQKLVTILCLALGIIAASATDTPRSPAGDRLAADLNQKLNSTLVAYVLFAQSVGEGRPALEVAHTMDVLADMYDRLCAQSTQFCLWYRSAPAPENFSAEGRAQFAGFIQNSKILSSQIQGEPELETLLEPYQEDPLVKAAQERIINSYRTMEKLLLPDQAAPAAPQGAPQQEKSQPLRRSAEITVGNELPGRFDPKA